MKFAIIFIAINLSLWTSHVAHEESEGTVDQIQMGEYWMGAQVESKDLIGKVVLLEYWGS
ncbi:MAG: hypothetical protein ACI97A_002380 [Planctomycetota bacterium]